MSDQPKPRKQDAATPTTGEWTLVPCALHFNIVCGDALIYEGVTSEMQGNRLCHAHNAALAAEQEKLHERHKLCVDFETKWKAEQEKSRILGNMTDGFRSQLAAAEEAHDRDTAALAAAKEEAYDQGYEHGAKDQRAGDIAAAQQPLMDALKLMPEIAYETIINGAGVTLENLPNELQCICDAALAKIEKKSQR